MWGNWIILLCLSEGVTSLFIKSLENPGDESDAADTLAKSESHRRMKRWEQYGNRVWNDTIKIGFANFTNVYSQGAQYEVLRECTQMWTRPGYLEFQIMMPTSYHKAHITISYATIDRRTERAGYQTLAYSYPPRPQDPEGTKIVLGQPNWRLPLKKNEIWPWGSSFKLILCHEIGHTLGLQDNDLNDSIMYYNAAGNTAKDSVLDDDSSRGVEALYRSPINHYRRYPPPPTTTTRPTTTVRKPYVYYNGQWYRTYQ